MLLEIISFQTLVGVIVDLSSSFNIIFQSKGYHPLSVTAFFDIGAKISFHALLAKGMIPVDE